MSLSARSAQSAPRDPRAGALLVGVLAFAALVRWLAYTGFFGSDEVTYTESAFKLLEGDWRVDDYVGANRLGINLPVAGIAAVLGRTEFAAALFSLLASLGEVLLVTWVALRMFGPRAALFAGLLLASLPTHVHFAGRLMADAPLCVSITAAFVLFYEAEVRRWSAGHFLAGVCAGLTYWIKPPLLIFVLGAFAVYPLWARRLDPRWLWGVLGVVVAVVANNLLFWALTGNFWYVLDVVRQRQASGYLQEGIEAGAIVTDAHYYLGYLFGRIYHTGALGYLALMGMALSWMRRRGSAPHVRYGLAFAMLWGGALLIIFSLFPVSIRPLVFVPKQTNYMLVFVAPLCLLGGWALSALPPRWALAWASLTVAAGLALALLLQGSVAVFTANSRATLRLVERHPGAQFFVMSNAWRAANFEHLIGGADVLTRMHAIGRWRSVEGPLAQAGERFAVVDEATYAWDGSRPFPRPQDVPACWTETERIVGEPRGLGAGLLRAAADLPGLSSTPIGRRLRDAAQPRPARVYRIAPGGC